MEKLKYTSDTLFNGHKQLLLEMVDDRLHIVYGVLFSDVESERLLSPRETKHYLKLIDDLHIESWQEADPGGKMNHIGWEVEYDDVIHQGEHVYPVNYEKMLDLLDMLVPEAHLVNHDEIQEAVITIGDEILLVNRHYQNVSYRSPSRSFTITDSDLVSHLLSCISHYENQKKSARTVLTINVTKRDGTSTVQYLEDRRVAHLRHEIAVLFQSNINKYIFKV